MQAPTFVEERDFLDIFYPVLVEWINLTTKVPLHQYQDRIELQIVDLEYDIMINRFSVCLSDGVHWVKARVDRNMNWVLNRKVVKMFEIIHVTKTDGHPRTFNFELVSIIYIIVIIYLNICY